MVFVHRKPAFATVILGVKFLPGMNQISDAEMEKLEVNETFKNECQFNMVIGGSVESAGSKAVEKSGDMKSRGSEIAKEIASVNVEKAKEIINNIGDAHVLRALKEVDGRKGVSEAVEKRIADIDNQVGSDLSHVDVQAPDGDGADFVDKLGSDKESLQGGKGHSAIPALDKGKK